MSEEFVKAERRAIPVVIALAGKSGSGKTYSALLMAKGIAPEGKIAFIDTERGRGRMYADDPAIGEYFVSELHPPHTSDAYVQKIERAAKWGADVVIVDSASHEWTGIGGCLEQVDEIVARGGDKMKMIAWSRVKPRHRRFVNLIAAPPCHLILCLRAKDKMEERMVNGKKKWVRLDDPYPEQQADFIFEMTASAVIDDQHQAKWTKCPKPLEGVLKPGLITPQQGAEIAKWVAGGADFDQDTELHLSNLRNACFEHGTNGFREYWSNHIKGNQALVTAIEPHLDDLKANAERADQLNEQKAEMAQHAEQEGG